MCLVLSLSMVSWTTISLIRRFKVEASSSLMSRYSCMDSTHCLASTASRISSARRFRPSSTMPCEIVVFRYRFGVHFCRFPLLSFLPPSLAAFRSPWYARSGQGSSVSLPEVVALHRRGAYPIQAGHSIGIIHR